MRRRAIVAAGSKGALNGSDNHARQHSHIAQEKFPMNRFRLLIAVASALLLLAGSVPASYAQFGLKKPSLPKIGGESGNTGGAGSSVDGESAGVAAAEEAVKEAGNALPPLAYDKPFPPSILYSTMLNEGLLFRRDGQLWLEKMTIVFLPDKDASGNAVQYGINDGEHRLTSRLSNAGGDTLGTTYWLASPGSTFGQKGAFVNMSSTNIRGTDKFTLAPGRYALDFFIDGKRFQHVPFTVRQLVAGDAYDPQNILGIDGPWNDYGYLHIHDARPDSYVNWKMWLRNEDPNPTTREYDVQVTVTLKRDGKKVAGSGNSGHYSINGREWKRYEFQMTDPDKPNGTMFSGADIFNNPGKYEVVVEIDGKRSVYKFEVKDGKIRHSGRQVREGTDPLVYLEGGRDAWWIRKEGGTYE